MTALFNNTRILLLQFNFSNPKLIPSGIRFEPNKSAEEEKKTGGVMLISPTEKASLSLLLDQFGKEGYELTDAYYRRPNNPKNPGGKFNSLFFMFASHEYANMTGEFKKTRGLVYKELLKICETSIWTVKIFENPFFEKEGEEIPGQHAMIVNCVARVPLFQPDGNPVLEWKKNEHGNRIGDKPVPIEPDNYVLVIDESEDRDMAEAV